MKIKEMSKEQLREYHNQKTKEWRIKNPEKNHEARKQYKHSEKGKEANRKYQRKKSISPERREYMREYFRKHPKKLKQSREYIKNYMKDYLKKHENHNKYLIRQRDYHNLRKKLLSLYPRCPKCGSHKNLEMHHIEYSNLDLDNIIILCRNCHRQLHRKENNTGGKNGNVKRKC